MNKDRESLDSRLQEYGRQKTEGFLLKDLYVVIGEPRARKAEADVPRLDEAEHKRIFDEHIAHQLKLEEAGQLFASGPIFDEEGNRVGGLIILRAESFEDAKRILDQDPHRAHGLWDHTIHRWRVSEGSYSLTVKYSSQKAVLS